MAIYYSRGKAGQLLSATSSSTSHRKSFENLNDCCNSPATLCTRAHIQGVAIFSWSTEIFRGLEEKGWNFLKLSKPSSSRGSSLKICQVHKFIILETISHSLSKSDSSKSIFFKTTNKFYCALWLVKKLHCMKRIF